MASTLSDDIWMNSSEACSALSLTSKATQLDNHVPLIQTTDREVPGLTLSLEQVIGTTTYSTSGFACNYNTSTFAICAGSAAVVGLVDNQLRISQKFFRARQNASVSASQTVSSPYDKATSLNTPESRNYSTTSWRRKTFGVRSTGSPHVDHGVSPGRANIRQKTRAAACVSLSSDGRFLAVGEIGYNPRILIYSTTVQSTNDPLASLSEHTFGIRCLAFSPDSRWLCSVGDLHDGFIHLWAVNPRTGSAKLHSSNKCTSFVQEIAWIGNSIVSVGTRHVKVWRLNVSAPPSPSKSKFKPDLAEPVLPASPGPKTLSGRNCLLGPLLEATFTCVDALSDTRAVLCTERGSICILEDGDRTQRLYQVSNVDFSIRCVTVDRSTEQLYIGGKNSKIYRLTFDDLNRPHETEGRYRSSSTSSSSLASAPDELPALVAMGCHSNYLIAIDSSHSTRIYERANHEFEKAATSRTGGGRTHGSAVLGINLLLPSFRNSDFFTWSPDGKVIFWSGTGHSNVEMAVPLEQSAANQEDEPNELKVIRASQQCHFFVAGDKSGVLRMLQGDSWETALPIKAHIGEINDIAIAQQSEDVTLVVSCGRDRTTQVFRRTSSTLELLQTIDHHASSVHELQFLNEGNTLLSSSSDRTIIIHTLATVHESMAYIPTRIITLKSSPVSMTTAWDGATLLFVSTIDRQVYKYELSTGLQIQSARLVDYENNDTVLLSSMRVQEIKVSGKPLQIVIGVSSTDKSLRVHDPTTGRTLLKEYGHSEGITDVAIIKRSNEPNKSDYTLVSTGQDGTIMFWHLTYNLPISADYDSPTTPMKESTAFSYPLRRVISRSALSEYQKTLEANGMPPLPLPSSRSQSPSRLKKKPSRYSMATPYVSSTPKLTSILLPSRPNPQAPASPITLFGERPRLGERNRNKSAASLNKLDELNASVEQLAISLRSFRKMLNSPPAPDSMKPGCFIELEAELNLTLGLLSPKLRSAQARTDLDYETISQDAANKL